MARWWRTASLRARLILIGTAGLVLGLGVGGLALVQTLSYVLHQALDDGAMQIARSVAAQVDSGRLSDPLPIGGGTSVVQVVDGRGHVRAASAGADRLVPVLPADELAAARAGRGFYVSPDRAPIAAPIRVVAAPAGTAADPRTVLVAVSAQDVVHSVRIVRTTFGIAFPVVVAVLAVLAWWVVGLTLRPVEALRRGAAEITDASSAGRLPVPTGRDEVHRLAVTLNDMLGRLEAARVRQRAFVADAAHELRSPLASIRTQLEVAQRLGPKADWPETVADVLADLDRLGALTDDLLVLARMDEAPLPSSRDRVDLAVLAGDVTGRYGGAPVVVGVSAEAPAVVAGRPEELRRIVANLLDNAVRHAATRVEVSVRVGDGVVTLTVTDDGPGIPAADRERVFDRFTRLDDARARDVGGAGLGLPIVRELARRHGGSVVLTDADPGVRAEVRLPCVGGEVAPEDGRAPGIP